MESRFDQLNFERCKHSERLLLKAANGENYTENLEAVIHFYNTGIDKHKTVTQLEMLKELFKKSEKVKGLKIILDFLKEQNALMQVVYSN